MMRLAALLAVLFAALGGQASEVVTGHDASSGKPETLLAYFVGNPGAINWFDADKTYDADDCMFLFGTTETSLDWKVNCAGTSYDGSSIVFARDVVVTEFSTFNAVAMQYGGAFQGCKFRLHTFDFNTSTYTQLAEVFRVSTAVDATDNTTGTLQTQTLDVLVPAGTALQIAVSDSDNAGGDLVCPVPSSAVSCFCFGFQQVVFQVWGYVK